MNFELDPLSKLRMERDQQLKDINNQQINNNNHNMIVGKWKKYVEKNRCKRC